MLVPCRQLHQDEIREVMPVYVNQSDCHPLPPPIRAQETLAFLVAAPPRSMLYYAPLFFGVRWDGRTIARFSCSHPQAQRYRSMSPRRYNHPHDRRRRCCSFSLGDSSLLPHLSRSNPLRLVVGISTIIPAAITAVKIKALLCAFAVNVPPRLALTAPIPAALVC